MNKPVFALVDCNNFFVSCERLFRPDLEGKPVVVLSSNDGCAVARSNEAKALGIPMGAPVFKYRQLFREHGVVQFSANFELYGDISDRLTRLLMEVAPRLEVYSVDESFLDLSAVPIHDYARWARALRERIRREVGVPVSIGIAPTKTLAKLASHAAKGSTGVVDLTRLAAGEQEAHLERTPIEEVWGVGWRLAPKLKALGVFTARDLAVLPPRTAQGLMGIHGRQLVSELNGLSCRPLEPAHKVHQSIQHGRLFGADTSELSVMEAAIASLTARAAFRLRRDGLLTRSAVLSLSTNKHKPGYQKQSRFVSFTTPTADSGTIISKLVTALAELYNPGLPYHRADILLYDFVKENSLQTDLLGEVDLIQNDKARARMRALDALNGYYGKGTVHYAAEDLSRTWTPKHNLRSPRYTSNWQELPTARPAARR